MSWVWLALAILAVIGVYLSWTAGRLDRLHARIDAARAALDAQLFRRCGVVLEAATSGLLDPATSLLLADAARRARAGEDDGRELAESDLSRTLAVVFPDHDVVRQVSDRPGAQELLDELGAACRRVEMARRFLNDTVVMARGLRGNPIVRWFRLAGHAPWPETAELDSTPPPGLT